MGFATIAAQTILFVFLLVAVGQFFIYMKVSTIEDNSLLASKELLLEQTIRTDILIQNVSYNTTDDLLFIQIENTGKTVLDPNKTDIYINEIHIPRLSMNRTYVFDYSYTNPLFWDPKEIVIYTVRQLDLSSGDFVIRTVTEHGVGDVAVLEI